LAGAATSASAATILWIDDASSNIGTVNLTTGTATFVGNSNVGQTLTDIGFGGDGKLYGVSFNNIYELDQTTGQGALAGPANPSNGMNALVGAPGGALYAASNSSNQLFAYDTATDVWSAFGGSVGAGSAGDLAFSGGFLYEATIGAGGLSQLTRLTLSGSNITNSTVIGNFMFGAQSFNNVFGLASSGSTTYAVAGTTIYSVNLATAQLTSVLNYAGLACSGATCLGAANGTAFFAESNGGVIPEPSTWTMMLLGFGGLGAILRRARTSAPLRA
jgi:hypothetical protein